MLSLIVLLPVMVPLAVSVAAASVPVNVGDADKTLLPEPVLVVTPVPPFATGKVPVTPVVKGRPVPLVSVTEVGVPRTGVTSVGLVLRTTLPVPVDVVTPVPPFATANVPATVTAPVVAVAGVRPVVPKLMEETRELETVAQEGAAPVFPIRT